MKLLKMGVICLAGCLPAQSWAAAFANQNQTASAAGVANAVVAGADDLSAAVFNPAGLAWQDGVQALFGSQSRQRSLSVDVAGKVNSGDRALSDVGSFAVSWKPHDSDWGISGSITTPFSSRTDWTWAQFADQLAETNLHFERYSANAFWRVRNDLAISLGADSYNARMKLNSAGNSFYSSIWSNPSLNLGLRWEAAPFWYVGANYRQGADMTFENLGASSPFSLPDELSLGVAHDLMDDEWRLELDVKQTAWSGVPDLKVSQAGVVSQNIPMALKDSIDVAFGATWFWRNETQLRFGYAYEQGANPESGFQPAVSDQTGHRISAGFGGVLTGLHWDMAMSYIYYPAMTATGNYAGSYSDMSYNFLFSLTKKF